MRRFHLYPGVLPSGQRYVEQRVTECLIVDCEQEHVYALDRFEGQALRDLIDERRMRTS